MSFDVELRDDKIEEPLEVKNHADGGTYAVGGTTYPELNITYNYSKYYYEFLNKEEGLQWINGKRAKDTINSLKKTVDALGTKRDDDYWAATPGNAGYAVLTLLKWAEQYPNAIWSVM